MAERLANRHMKASQFSADAPVARAEIAVAVGSKYDQFRPLLTVRTSENPGRMTFWRGTGLFRQVGRENSRGLLGTKDVRLAHGRTTGQHGDSGARLRDSVRPGASGQRDFRTRKWRVFTVCFAGFGRKSQIAQNGTFELLCGRRKCNAYIQKALPNDLRKGSLE
jgi:hypothetical protein